MTGLLRANRAAETRKIRDFIDSHQGDLVAQLCEWALLWSGLADADMAEP